MKNHTFIALFLCAVIFLTAVARSRTSKSSDTDYSLAVRGGKLTFESADASQVGRGGEITPEMTPFLFLKIPVNKADPLLLEAIPGVGPSLAGKIISYRDEAGIIEDRSTMLKVRGIGPVKLKMLDNYISYEQ